MSDTLHLSSSPFSLLKHDDNYVKWNVNTELTNNVKILKQKLLDSSVISGSVVNSLAALIDLTDYQELPAMNNWDGKVREFTLSGVDNPEEYQAATECVLNLVSTIAQYGSNDCLTITTSQGQVISLKTYASGDWIQAYDPVSGTYKNIIYRTFDAYPEIICHICANVPTLDGSTIALPDLAADLANCEKIQEIMSDSIVIDPDHILSYDLGSTLKQYEDQSNSDITSVINTMISSAQTSGLGGVLNYIKDLYAGLNSVQQDQQTGLIDFMDDKQYLPKSFLTGCLGAIVTTIGSCISAILTVINPILGLVSFAITGLASLVMRYMDLSSKARGQYINNVGSTPLYPVSFIAHDFQVENITFENAHPDYFGQKIFNTICGNKIPYLVHHKCAYHVFSSDGTVFRVNAFIDTLDRTGLLRSVADGVTREVWPGEGVNFHEYIYTFNSSNLASLVETTQNLREFQPIDELVDDGLSTDDDLRLRRIIAVNLVLWFATERYGAFSDIFLNDLQVYTSNVAHQGWLINGYDASGLNITVSEFNALKDLLASVARYAVVGEDYAPGISWSNIYYCCKALQNHTVIEAPNEETLFSSVLWNAGWVFRDAFSYVNFNSKLIPTVIPANYDPNELLASLILLTSVAIIAVTAVAVCTTVARRKLMNKAALNAAKTEQAWNRVVQNPTAENLKAYNSMRFKNNIWASVFGGTKYSRLGFWSDTSVGQDGSLTSRLLSKVKESNQKDNVTLNTLAKLITGDTY